MLKKSDFTKQVYKTGEVAKILGVTNQTIQNYDRDGKLKVGRSGGGHRAIAREDLLHFLEEKGLLYDDTQKEISDVIYARVSSHDQKSHGDLDRQALFLVEHVHGLQNPVILKEVGSGLNAAVRSGMFTSLIKTVLPGLGSAILKLFFLPMGQPLLQYGTKKKKNPYRKNL